MLASLLLPVLALFTFQLVDARDSPFRFTHKARRLTLGSRAAATWTSQGCFIDDGSNRGLSSYSYSDSAMTIDMCTTKCASLGYTFAGLQYSSEFR